MAGAKTAGSRLVVLARPAARASRPSPKPSVPARDAGDWRWVPASRKTLLIDAKKRLGGRPRLAAPNTPFTLTPDRPAVADRAFFYAQSLEILVADPDHAYFRFGSSAIGHSMRMFGFKGWLPPHCAALIDVPIRPQTASSPLELHVFAYNLVHGTSPVLEVVADQVVTFAQPGADTVHLGVLLSDVGPADGDAASLDVSVTVQSPGGFAFSSLTVTPL